MLPLPGENGSVWRGAVGWVGIAAVSPAGSTSTLSEEPHSAQNRLIPLLRAPQTGQVRLDEALEEVMCVTCGAASRGFVQEVGVDGERIGHAEAFHHDKTDRIDIGEPARAS